MKRKTAGILSVVIAGAVLLAACGGSGTKETSEAEQTAASSAEAQAEETASSVSVEEEAEEEAETVSEVPEAQEEQPEEAAVSEPAAEEETAEEESAHPYAWLGLQDMPECAYLDVFATYHYMQTYDSYTMGLSTEETEAVDGANTYKENATNRTYAVDGKAVSVNENSKIYAEMDMGDTSQAAEMIKAAQESGENMFGRSFVGTGSGQIPEYCDVTGDTAEYEYYEYDYPETEEATGYKMVERYYMKDGDVYAIYQVSTTGDDTEYGLTKVIKSISGEIPEGTFTLPDLSGYEKYGS